MTRLNTTPDTKVATAAGFVVESESLLMQSLSNADEARQVDRSRYFLVRA